MVDGQYTAILRSEDQEDSVPIMIDNTAPVFGELLAIPRFDGRMDYSITVQDPLVNGAASGLKDLASLKLQASVDGEDTQLADLRMDAGDFSIASTGGQTYTLRFTYAGTNALLLQGIDLLANVGSNAKTPQLLKKRCSNQGITLLNAYDYYRVRQGENRAVTLYFLVKSPGRDYNRTYPPSLQFQQNIKAYSSLADTKNIMPAVKSFSFERLYKDLATAAIIAIGQPLVGGGVTPILAEGGVYPELSDSGLPRKLQKVGPGKFAVLPSLEKNEFLFILSPDLNLVPYGNQTLTIEIPNYEKNNKTLFNLNFKKGANSTWSEIACL